MVKNTLPQRLIQARKAKKWTQLDLAKALNVNVKNISRWELGNARPTIDAAVDLCKALEVSMDSLVGLSSPSGNSDPLMALLGKKLDSLTPEKRKALETILQAF